MSTFTLVFTQGALDALRALNRVVYVAFTTFQDADGDINVGFVLDTFSGNLSQTFRIPTGLPSFSRVVLRDSNRSGLLEGLLSNPAIITPGGTYYIYRDRRSAFLVTLSVPFLPVLNTQIRVFNTSPVGAGPCGLVDPQIIYNNPFPLPPQTFDLNFTGDNAAVVVPPQTALTFVVRDQGVTSTPARRVVRGTNYQVECVVVNGQRTLSVSPSIPPPPSIVVPTPPVVPTTGSTTVVVIKSRC